MYHPVSALKELERHSQCRGFSDVKGVTLIEVMIGLLIVTIAFVSLTTVFTAIAKSILVNKTKTIAVNLAQEKIESLKDLSYYKLLVTTSVAPSDPNFPSAMYYDQGTTSSYYPEETLYVGGSTFLRRVFVEYLFQDGNELVGYPTLDWTANDTGIKRVTVYVVWEEGSDWKKVELRNLRNNPNRAELEYSFTGKVSSSAGNPIYNAYVDTMQNPSYFGRTDASGNFSFKVQAGTYTLRATATGYFTAVSTNYVVSVGESGSSNHPFSMTLKSQGEATGYAYIRDHLVISQVVASTHTSDNGGWEWVELYNPTTYNILIASRATSTSSWDVFFVTVTYICRNNDEPPDSPGNGHPSRHLIGYEDYLDFTFRSTSTHWTANTTTISIPSHSFFLIANVSTITTIQGLTPLTINRIADAYYYDTTGYDPTDPINAIKTSENGGIRVTGERGYSFNSRTDWHDGLGWWGGGTEPELAREGSSYSTVLLDQYMFLRWALKLTDSYTDWTFTRLGRSYNPPNANNFDRDSNGLTFNTGSDWSLQTISNQAQISTIVANVDINIPPGTGAPATGGSVSFNDGESVTSYLQKYGSFTVAGIATGTWTMTISSGTYTRDVSNIEILADISSGIPNGSTVPPWEFETFSSVALTTSSIYGYVSGQVVDANGNGLDSTIISAPGAIDVLTGSDGTYRISIVPSDMAVSVQATKSGYSTDIAYNIGVTLGVNISTVNFTLVSAGSITGFVTTNGSPSGALPGVPIVATDLSSTTVIGSAISGVDGNFTIFDISTGTYIVSPQLESGEASVPGSVLLTVTTLSTGTLSSTFTVTNAFGEISGTVGLGSSTAPITTGVLVVASSATIDTVNPPSIDSTVRSDGLVYYSVASNASGRYNLPVRGGTSYYLYAWYTSSLDVSVSSTTKATVSGISVSCPLCHFVNSGETISRNITW